MPVINALVIAFATYSRIPMPRVDWSDSNRRYVMCFFPLIGGVIGLLLWGWLALCDALAVGSFLKGAAGALIPLLITGGIHMDGLMDTSDALASWQTKERRLEILKDSHVGAFGVIACAGYLLLSAALIGEMTADQGLLLLFVFVLSRSLSAWALTVFPNARPEGMLGSFSRTAHKRQVAASTAVYSLICVLAWIVGGGWLSLACMAAAGLVLIYYRHMALKYFGGVTGDLAGWFLQITELALTAVILLGGKM